MGKEMKHRRDEKKKPQLSIKEKRARKQEKRMQRQEHQFDVHTPPENQNM